MRWLAAIILFLSLFAAPVSACDHDHSGMSQDGGVAHEMPMVRDTASMHHNMSMEGNAHEVPAVDNDAHCPDGCTGGSDCEACQASLAATIIDGDADVTSRTMIKNILTSETPDGRVALADPPPPKHLFL